MKTIFTAALLALATTAVVAPAQAATWTLTSTNGGDGFVVLGPFNILGTLFGSDNNVGGSLTTYTRVANAPKTLRFNYVYTTNDRDGSDYDPAGYVIDGVFTQLSAAGLPNGGSNSGTAFFSVVAGQTFGAYVNSTDSQLGRGLLQVRVSEVPEAATWMLMIAGFGMVGVAARRRKVVDAA